MGVYIKGIEMPKEGNWKTVRIYPDGSCAVPNWQGDCTFIKGTKAVSIPKHGRLIDADAYEQLLYSLDNRDYRREKGSIKDAIKFLHSNYTPTIIPAEKGTDIHKEFMQNSHEEVE